MTKRQLTIDDAERGARHFTWHAADGTELPGLAWEPDNKPRVNVLCIHGLSGAAADFGPLGRQLAQNGCAVHAANLRGQGNDPAHDRRGHLLDPEAWRKDLEKFAGGFAQQAPLVVVGESMGSLVTIDLIAHGALQPSRAVLAAPVPALRAPVPDWAVKLVSGGARVFPRLRLKPMRFVHGKRVLPRLTADDDYMEYLQGIPHRVGGYTLEFLANFHGLMSNAQELAEHVRVPTLMLSAGRDAFIRGEQSHAFFEKIGAPVKEYEFYPESHHLLWHDINRDEVLDRITRWVLGAAD